ncbi:DUF378 domain-containing protein [Solibacillus sp. FSL H8-0538]|uniref:DUF378 domain-containing protein n=1 Tax=Solibacillus sp. FSL H8-0538 TaxID=2921400 RepID=UPI0030FB38E1
MGVVYRIALILVIVGAINWGLIGFFQFDLVAYLFGGQAAMLSRWVYALVGLAGLVSIPILSKELGDDESDPNYVSDSRASTTTQIYSKPSYDMEAGEEVDFTEAKKTHKKDSDEKKS